MSRIDWGWVLGVSFVLWPFAFCALLAIRRGGRALRSHARRAGRALTRHSQTRRSTP
jgi:hypothetical protein